MKVSVIKCPSCEDQVYSRARHDYRSCSCGECSIDGGFDYQKVGFKNIPPQVKSIEINVTKKELYDDWSEEKDKYGLIKETDIVKVVDKIVDAFEKNKRRRKCRKLMKEIYG